MAKKRENSIVWITGAALGMPRDQMCELLSIQASTYTVKILSTGKTRTVKDTSLIAATFHDQKLNREVCLRVTDDNGRCPRCAGMMEHGKPHDCIESLVKRIEALERREQQK